MGPFQDQNERANESSIIEVSKNFRFQILNFKSLPAAGRCNLQFEIRGDDDSTN